MPIPPPPIWIWIIVGVLMIAAGTYVVMPGF